MKVGRIIGVGVFVVACIWTYITLFSSLHFFLTPVKNSFDKAPGAILFGFLLIIFSGGNVTIGDLKNKSKKFDEVIMAGPK